MKASSRLSADPELAFVAAASAPAPSLFPAYDLDWPRVIRHASRHRVYPRVWAHAAAHFPEKPAAAMRAIALENSVKALANVARTVQLVRLLRGAGVDTLVLKGPLLAHDLFGDVALRVAGDIDLLVRRPQLLEACRILAEAGYQPEQPITPSSLERQLRRRHDVSFVHPEDGTLVELHADIAQPHYGFRVDLAEWWAGRRERRMGDEVLWLPGLDHAYLLTALHAAKHRWHRLDLIGDVAAFRQLGIDGSSVHREHVPTWLLGQIRHGEALAAWLFAGNGPRTPLISDVEAQLVAGEDLGRWAGVRFDVRLRPGWREKGRYLLRRFITAKAGL